MHGKRNFTITNIVVGAAITILLVLLAVLDSLTPLGFAHGFLYLPVLLLAATLQNRTVLRWITAVSIIFIFSGSLWSAPPWDDEATLHVIASHRLLSVLVLLTVHSLIEKYASLIGRLETARSESEFQRLSDNLPILIWTADANGKFDYFARPVAEYTGVDQQTMLKNWQVMVHEDDRAHSEHAWLKAVSTKTEFRAEFRIKVRTGGYEWFVVQAKPVFDTQGRVLKWYGSGINIADLKELQGQTLKQAKRYYNVLESITDGFFTLNTLFNFTYVNNQAGKMLGVSVGDLLGKPVWFPSAGLSEEIFEPMQSSYRMQESISFTQLLTHNQTWLEVSIYPSSEGLSVFLRDVTQERELQQQLNHAQRIESLGHLTGGVAHDFNNLLTVIVGNTDLLLRYFDQQKPDNEKLIKVTTLVMNAAERGVTLTDKLLAFSRRQKLTPEVVDVNLLLKELEYLLVTTLGAEHSFALKLHSEPLHVCIDAGQLEHVLLNLVINARDAMAGSGAVTVGVYPFAGFQQSTLDRDSLVPGHYALIEVMDTGTGIPNEIKHRIFEPFFTTKETGKGTGLGLSSAYGFIKQSGGHINVSSHLGEGSVFRLYLPLSNALPNREKQALTRYKDTSEQRDHTVLLVEDDPMVRTYAEQALEDAGYKVISAENGEFALQILRSQNAVDVLFSDVIMPGQIDGFELAKQTNQLDPSLPVLLTSGYPDMAAKHHIHKDWRNSILMKPYRSDELIARIQALLHSRVR
ncbi:hypothetical protein CWE12_02655 [Aliidiomarina sedimenti]|uniref:histidine kinase n=1 Tax=Aliidiomarina sedimenti TaxID=1933879 RepID=A0ABY0C293_9GAMM|nr:ATP-binding protein [Aliidiomarina sedimenti]RUO31916.1 hypothetical protein CWE12_02655 [Aliidiomarina sedimenti]